MQTMRQLILMAICTFLFLACDKETNTSFVLNAPKTPINDSLDINNDKLFDFYIGYKSIETTDIPSSSGSIIGFIRPTNENKLLCRDGQGCFFLNKNDIISKKSDKNFQWNSFEADFISINRTFDTWDEKWHNISNDKKSVKLGYKIVVNKSEKIGWLNLTYNPSSGKITVLGGGQNTDKDELTVQ